KYLQTLEEYLVLSSRTLGRLAKSSMTISAENTTISFTLGEELVIIFAFPQSIVAVYSRSLKQVQKWDSKEYIIKRQAMDEEMVAASLFLVSSPVRKWLSVCLDMVHLLCIVRSHTRNMIH
uniref:Uncharacterized protein n=1 Tax=Buteo japonicus TaxID=224669 RepID=A0A8B9Z8M0_9AVES